jgi:hypothetical protein
MSRDSGRWHVDAEQVDHVASRYGIVSQKDFGLAQENDRIRRKNRILKEEG